MTNPYEPPKSDITGTQILVSKLVVYPADRKTLLLSFLCIALPWILLGVRDFQGGFDVMIQLAIAKAMFTAACILSLYYLRGLEFVSNRPPYEKSRLGVWGVVWRCIIAIIVAVISSVILFKLFEPSFSGLPGFIVANMLQLLVAIIVVWVLFSTNRRGQIQWCLGLIRGW